MAVRLGTILVEDGTELPGSMSVQASALSSTWQAVPDVERAGLEAQIVKSGWTMFYMAGIIHKHAFGFDEQKRERAAVGRVIQNVQSEKCNCLEITSITTKGFLGIPYVSITAHARHIQDGTQFRAR